MTDQDLPVKSRDAPLRKPAPEEMKPSAIARRVLKEALLHPASIYPWTASAALLMWILINGPSLALVGGMLATFFVGGVSFLVNYLGLGQDRAREIAEQLLQLYKQCEAQEEHDQDQAEIQQARNIMSDSRRSEFEEIAGKTRDLENSYGALLAYIEGNAQARGADRYRKLAAKAYKEAARVLKDACETRQAMQSVDIEALDSELKRLQLDRQSQADHTNKARALDREIEAVQRKIEVYRQQEARLTGLLAAVTDIDSKFQSVRLTLTEREGRDPDADLQDTDNAAEQLVSAAEADLRVERKRRGEKSEEERAIDDKYLRAGRDAQLDRQ